MEIVDAKPSGAVVTNQQSLLMFFRYLKGTLDQYVESDYTLIYFHHGLTSENKPSLSWVRDAYREFDRK